MEWIYTETGKIWSSGMHILMEIYIHTDTIYKYYEHTALISMDNEESDWNLG